MIPCIQHYFSPTLRGTTPTYILRSNDIFEAVVVSSLLVALIVKISLAVTSLFRASCRSILSYLHQTPIGHCKLEGPAVLASYSRRTIIIIYIISTTVNHCSLCTLLCNIVASARLKNFLYFCNLC